MLFNQSKFILTIGLLSLCLAFDVIADDQKRDAYFEGFVAAERGEYDSAVRHWGPLASQGHAEAQFNIALMYHSGSGVPIDEQEAIKWYQKSAENGYHKAQEYLAAGYAHGWFGLNADPEKAVYWEMKALESLLD